MFYNVDIFFVWAFSMSIIENKISVKESELIQSIVKKINAYMEQNGQTLFNLAQTTGFAYQPLHRLMKGISVPNLSSLAMLSDYLNCSIAELISDEFFIDVDVIANIKELPDYKSKLKSRIYIPYDDFMPHISRKFILLAESENSTINKVFYITNEIIGDGEFIVIYKKQHVIMNVVLSSSKFILIEKNAKEERIPVEEVQVLAKLFKHSMMYDHTKNQIKNSVITGSK